MKREGALSSVLGCFLIFQYFQSLKLGRHTPITKALREGILKVGAKRAGKLENETEHDEWFSSIGDAPMAELLRLYSKVSICLTKIESFLQCLKISCETKFV